VSFMLGRRCWGPWRLGEVSASGGGELISVGGAVLFMRTWTLARRFWGSSLM